MQVQIVIFLAFTSVTLIFNAVVIWLAYKAFFSASLKVTETVREFETADSARVWLEALQYASSNMVSISESVKDRLAASAPELAHAEARYGFKLAQLDLQIERSFAKVLHVSAKVEGAVSRPAHRVGATLSGICEVLKFFATAKNDDDATSTPK